jgi:hypothetical protein
MILQMKKLLSFIFLGAVALGGCSRTGYYVGVGEQIQLNHTYSNISKTVAQNRVTYPDNLPLNGFNTGADVKTLNEARLLGFVQTSPIEFKLKYVDGSEFSAKVKRTDNVAEVSLQRLNSDSSFHITFFDKPRDSSGTFATLISFFKGKEISESEHRRATVVTPVKNVRGVGWKCNYQEYKLEPTAQSGTRLLEAAFSLAVNYDIKLLNESIIYNELNDPFDRSKVFLSGISKEDNLEPTLLTKISAKQYSFKLIDSEEYLVDCSISKPRFTQSKPKDLSKRTEKYLTVSYIKFNKPGNDTSVAFKYELINVQSFYYGRITKTVYVGKKVVETEITYENEGSLGLFNQKLAELESTHFNFKNNKHSTIMKAGLYIIADDLKGANSRYLKQERLKLLTAK